MTDAMYDIKEKLRDVNGKFSELEKDIIGLRSENANVKGVLAAVMKRVGRLDDFDIKEVYKSDYEKVKIMYNEDKSEVSIVYVNDEINS